MLAEVQHLGSKALLSGFPPPSRKVEGKLCPNDTTAGLRGAPANTSRARKVFGGLCPLAGGGARCQAVLRCPEDGQIVRVRN